MDKKMNLLFTANSAKSFQELVVYIGSFPYPYTVHPLWNSIAISDVDNEQAQVIGDEIEEKKLDVKVTRIAIKSDISEISEETTSLIDPSTATFYINFLVGMVEEHKKTIEELANKNEKSKEAEDRYYRWWNEEKGISSRITQKLNAIKAVVDALYEKTE